MRGTSNIDVKRGPGSKQVRHEQDGDGTYVSAYILHSPRRYIIICHSYPHIPLRTPVVQDVCTDFDRNEMKHVVSLICFCFKEAL